MRIGLIQLDGTMKNIALEKIKLYYTQQKCLVKYITPIEAKFYDKVYCSSIFTHSDKSYINPEWECGGSGFDIHSKLSPAMDKLRPKINMGFTTRGCIRKCPFCIAWKKEGKIRIEGDIYSIWDRKSKEITLLDNNILAIPGHFKRICEQIKKEKLKVDFNQGLDIRLLNKHNLKILKSIRRKEYRFAFDMMKDEKIVVKGIKMLTDIDIKWSIFYVLVGFNTTFEEDLYRANLLKSLKQNVFIQRYNYNGNWSRKYNELASWCSRRKYFHAQTFEEYCKMRKFNFVKMGCMGKE